MLKSCAALLLAVRGGGGGAFRCQASAHAALLYFQVAFTRRKEVTMVTRFTTNTRLVRDYFTPPPPRLLTSLCSSIHSLLKKTQFSTHKTSNCSKPLGRIVLITECDL